MSQNADPFVTGDHSLPPGAITAYRLLGDYDFKTPASRPGFLRSSQILATLLTSDHEAARIREVLSAPSTYGDFGALCFIPRLGFTVGAGHDAVDILICLECTWAYFFRGDSHTPQSLSAAGHQLLSALQRELFPDTR